MTDVQVQAEGVRLQIDTPAGGYALHADWLIDASGANSAIRRAVGARGSESHSDDRWCISDVRFRQPKPMERWTWVDAPFNEGRAVWQHLMADDVWRLDYQMAPDADPQAVSRPDVVAQRVRRQLGDDVDFEFVWIGPYQYRDHLLDDFRHGRLFFVGDAAHVVSPFGARGGNNGIQDAANLGWKLAAVLRGVAADTLLDSYGAERRAAALENLEVTRRTARFLAPRSGAERELRRAVLALARDHPFARPLVNTGRMAVANDYPRSDCLPDGARSVRNLRLARVDGSQTSLNELLRGDTRLLGFWFDPPAGVFGDGHPALEIVPVYAEPSRLADGAAHARGLLDDGRLAAELGVGAGTLCVVRPDGYLAATLEGADAERLDGVVERILPRAPQRMPA